MLETSYKKEQTVIKMKLVILAGVIMDSQQQEPKHTPL